MKPPSEVAFVHIHSLTFPPPTVKLFHRKWTGSWTGVFCLPHPTPVCCDTGSLTRDATDVGHLSPSLVCLTVLSSLFHRFTVLVWWRTPGIIHSETSQVLLYLKTSFTGTSLVVQWLRICLPMQENWVRSPVREDPTCCGTTKPVHHNYWAQILEPESHNYWAHLPQLSKPRHPKSSCSTAREATTVKSSCTTTRA